MRLLLSIFVFIYSISLSATNLHPEERLLEALDDIQASNFSSAELKLSDLLKQVPDFKLAQLVYADLLNAKIKPLSSVAMELNDGLEKTQLLAEIRSRYQTVNDNNNEQIIPSVLARLDAHYQHAIVIDLNKSRLYLFENTQQKPQLINDYFVSMGRSGPGKEFEGDLKTPLGVYFIQSYIGPSQLADKYGDGAYPINYPNAWDRLNGKTGHGIWLHGTRSGTYNRPVLASEGCVVLPNDDLLAVGKYIDLKNTPIIIGENIQWLTKEQWIEHRQLIGEIQDAWLNDWQSLNVDDYLGHYSKRFMQGKKDFNYWSKYKRRIAKHKSYVNVKLSNISWLVHPNEDVLVATFLQEYASDNFASTSWKRQYWHKEDDGKWRIVFEGEIASPMDAGLALNRKF